MIVLCMFAIVCSLRVVNEIAEMIDRWKDWFDFLNFLEYNYSMEKIYYVYEHICPDKSLYIGITDDLYRRFGYNGCNYRNQEKFYEKIKQYGWKNIEHTVIGFYDSKGEAEKQEYESIMSAIMLGQNVLNKMKTSDSEHLLAKYWN